MSPLFNVSDATPLASVAETVTAGVRCQVDGVVGAITGADVSSTVARADSIASMASFGSPQVSSSHRTSNFSAWLRPNVRVVTSSPQMSPPPHESRSRSAAFLTVIS